MKKRLLNIGCACMIALLLAGCMYPNNARGGQHVSPRESAVVVQAAVDQYLADKRILPIKTFDANTDFYERYAVDMRKLIQEGYMSQPPPAAFERGGKYYFVIVDPEEKPTVKMLDISIIQKAGEVQRAVDDYRRKNHGKLPLGPELSLNWHDIDYEALRMAPVEMKSPFSPQNVALMIHREGQVAVNYAAEIMKLIQQLNIENPQERADLRSYLAEHSYFVPAKSVPYIWQDDRPVAEP